MGGIQVQIAHLKFTLSFLKKYIYKFPWLPTKKGLYSSAICHVLLLYTPFIMFCVYETPAWVCLVFSSLKLHFESLLAKASHNLSIKCVVNRSPSYCLLYFSTWSLNVGSSFPLPTYCRYHLTRPDEKLPCVSMLTVSQISIPTQIFSLIS